MISSNWPVLLGILISCLCARGQTSIDKSSWQKKKQNPSVLEQDNFLSSRQLCNIWKTVPGMIVDLAAAAAAAAKSLQSCPTLCNPIDGSPPGSPIPGILQARTLEWVAISFSNAWKWKVKLKSLIRVRLFATPWTACSLPGSSIHGIFQARVLEWGAVAFSGLWD